MACKPNIGSFIFWRLLIGTIIRLAASFLGEAVIMSAWTCFAAGFQLFALSSAQWVWNCGRLATVYQALKESALQIDLTTRRQTAVSVVTRQEASCIALLLMCHSSTVERCHFLIKPNFGDWLLRWFVGRHGVQQGQLETVVAFVGNSTGPRTVLACGRISWPCPIVRPPHIGALVQGKYVMEDGNCTFGIVHDLCNDSKGSIYHYWQ